MTHITHNAAASDGTPEARRSVTTPWPGPVIACDDLGCGAPGVPLCSTAPRRDSSASSARWGRPLGRGGSREPVDFREESPQKGKDRGGPVTKPSVEDVDSQMTRQARPVTA